jgi:hypothetical protein
MTYQKNKNGTHIGQNFEKYKTSLVQHIDRMGGGYF